MRAEGAGAEVVVGGDLSSPWVDLVFWGQQMTGGPALERGLKNSCVALCSWASSSLALPRALSHHSMCQFEPRITPLIDTLLAPRPSGRRGSGPRGRCRGHRCTGAAGRGSNQQGACPGPRSLVHIDTNHKLIRLVVFSNTAPLLLWFTIYEIRLLLPFLSLNLGTTLWFLAALMDSQGRSLSFDFTFNYTCLLSYY